MRLCAATIGLTLSTVPVLAAETSREPRVVVTGVDFAAGIAFADDGTMYFTERSGRVRVVRDGRIVRQPLLEMETTTSGETGFLGLAVAPDQRSVYVFVTDPSGTSNKIVRVPAEGGEGEVVVEGLPGSGYHNGGGVTFLEGHLLVTNGEVHDSVRSQDPNALGGKVYRFTPAGEVPDDNPFPGTATFALGLRNPYAIAIDPLSGAPFVTENGPESHDEVNRIDAGGNYGWPDTSGPAPDPSALAGLAGDYHEPLLDYPKIIVPTGIAFADPEEAIPPFGGDLFFATFGEQSIHQVELSEDRTEAVSDEVLLQEDAPLIALAWGPAGLYYSTPDSIKVLPLARKGDGGGTAPPAPQAANDDPGVLVRWTRPGVLAAVVVVLLAALYLLNRRGRDRSEETE